MILIHSIDGDISTTEVMRWLRHYGQTVVRLNEADQIQSVESIEVDHFCLRLKNGTQLPLSLIAAYWYRRNEFRPQIPQLALDDNPALGEQLMQFGFREQQVMLNYLYDLLADKPSIGSLPRTRSINKLQVLKLAQAVGLDIPPSLVTSEKAQLARFLGQRGRLITKALSDPFTYFGDEYWLPTYTELIDEQVLAQLPDHFGPSLFQPEIPKRFEIRTFYLDGNCYSMAIFSQNDQQTQTDFRRYNYERPNRQVPFALPDFIQVPLCQLMQKLGFRSGSIDFIYTPERKFYFLEVNPVGQFGMVSAPCNYFIERQIAQALIQPTT